MEHQQSSAHRLHYSSYKQAVLQTSHVSTGLQVNAKINGSCLENTHASEKLKEQDGEERIGGGREGEEGKEKEEGGRRREKKRKKSVSEVKNEEKKKGER